eukprot:m.1088 g.1088  ORF g.1088 m.1088 type:complete len:344 (+) comp5661_c0_seq1:97-1128(+)
MAISLKTALVFALLLPSSAHIHRVQRPLQSHQHQTNDDHLTATAAVETATSSSYWTWTAALTSAALVGATGIFPLFLIGLDYSPSKSPRLHRFLLSFAGGGLLGDIFLHLLPETWGRLGHGNGGDGDDLFAVGLWVIGGFLVFLFVEKMASESEEEEKETIPKPPSTMLNGGNVSSVNGGRARKAETEECKQPAVKIGMSGYLNLAANCADNLTHGLAISAAYMIGYKVGVLTTMAILLHELPHEIGDFAILLNAGFDHWTAAKAQMATASGGLIGAAAGLAANEIADSTAWILPFTAGGFLYIATVTVLPEMIKELCPVESVKQMLGLVSGIFVMGIVSFFE